MESRLTVIDKKINACKALASSSEGNSALVNQLMVLRNEVKTKAEIDYIGIQKKILEEFKTLMEDLTILAFYAKDAEKDTKPINKAIQVMNNIKSEISDGLLVPDRKGDGSSGEGSGDGASGVPEGGSPAAPPASVASAAADGDEGGPAAGKSELAKVIEDVRTDKENPAYCPSCGYYSNYESWYKEASGKEGNKLQKDGDDGFVARSGDGVVGFFNLGDGEGVLFDSAENFQKVFDMKETEVY